MKSKLISSGNYFILGFLFLAQCHKTNAQILQNDVIASQGNFSQINEASITWTLGEITSSYHSNNFLIYNEGFNQPFDGDNYPEVIDENFIIISNPTSEITTLILKKFDTYTVTIFNTIGQVVYIQKLDGVEFKINLKLLASAVYLINVNSLDGRINASRKLIKINTYE
jgi:hypothetical protein